MSTDLSQIDEIIREELVFYCSPFIAETTDLSNATSYCPEHCIVEFSNPIGR
jgi:hypothetical protein